MLRQSPRAENEMDVHNGVYTTLCLRRSVILAKSQTSVLNVATVDVPGVITSIP